MTRHDALHPLARRYLRRLRQAGRHLPPDRLCDLLSDAHFARERASWREYAAVILLPLGGFAFGIGWLMGVFLLWTSRFGRFAKR